MRAVVVGGGVAASHAALTLLERGHEVELWDVGREEIAFGEAGTTFHALKSRLDDPVSYLLGTKLDALIPPDAPELLRYPPSRRFLADPEDPLWPFVSDRFHPFGSFAKGGLANGWGANALSFDEDDLAGWPVSYGDMESAYRTVYRRIPVAGPESDDLTEHLRGVFPSQPPVRLSATDERMLESYRRHERRLRRSGVRMGRARLAVVTDPSRPDACVYCDRCLWGCPSSSIYNPATSTLEECERHPGFQYLPGRLVLALTGRPPVIDGIRYLDTRTQEIREERCDAVFLAAGALQTGAIFLRTLKDALPGTGPESEGLMDTAIVKIPYVVLRSVGLPAEARSFQFNRLIVGLTSESPPWPRYLHGELMQLTSLIYHPLIARMPFDSRLSKTVFFALKSALGAATLFFPDRISPRNRQVLVDRGRRWDDVELHYEGTADREQYVQDSVSRMRSALLRLGCLPRSAIRSPPGAGIHYAGTVPMGSGPRRCDSAGRSNVFRNLFIADGAAFPTLPSKSITMSLAAHATRVAMHADV